MLLADAASDALAGSTIALAIAAMGAAVREIIGWLRDRDAKKHDTEKALLAQKVETLEKTAAELIARLERAEQHAQECQQDRDHLHDRLSEIAAKLEAAAGRERVRHPHDQTIPPDSSPPG